MLQIQTQPCPQENDSLLKTASHKREISDAMLTAVLKVSVGIMEHQKKMSNQEVTLRVIRV